jgi:class 3 adenylate cyclase
VNLLEVVREVRRHLEENGRLSLRMLRRQFDLDGDALEEVIEELVDVQHVARREENALAWSATTRPNGTPPPEREPRAHTPKHLADRVLAEQAAMESRGAQDGERKTITALFADIKSSVELMEGLDPEEARAIVDPAL